YSLGSVMPGLDGPRTEGCVREPGVEGRVIQYVVVGVADRVHRVGREGNRCMQILRRRMQPERLLRLCQDFLPPGGYRVWPRALCLPRAPGVPARDRGAKPGLAGPLVSEGRPEGAAGVEGRLATLP